MPSSSPRRLIEVAWRRWSLAGLILLVPLVGCESADEEPSFTPATPFTPTPEGEPPTGDLRRRDRGPRADQGRRDQAPSPDRGPADAAVTPDVTPDADPPDVQAPDPGPPRCEGDVDCRFAVALDDCAICPVVVHAAALDEAACLVEFDALRPLEAYAPLECGAACRARAEQFCLRPLGAPACSREGRCFERELR